VQRKWLILALCAGLALVALLVWLGVEDARQAALLEARTKQGHGRVGELAERYYRLVREGAPSDEVYQAVLAIEEAQQDLEVLETERYRRQQSWHARLLREVRRRTGW
jgi:uncharacterized protein YdbL (DUF1318 family)